VSPALEQRARALDAADPLAASRERFTIPEGVVYLDGNSLGPLARHVPAAVQDVVRRQWGEQLIGSWQNSRWWSAPTRVGDRIAGLLGAAAGQVVVADSTSVNVFKLLVAALRAAAPRTELLVDATTFPSDGYAAESVARLTGATAVRVHPDDVAAALSTRTAAVLLNHVDFLTGRMYDMAGLNDTAHAVGALTVWDLSHSAGVLPLELDGVGVDFAVGATYKFLNGGPGAPAFSYVASRWQAGLDQPLAGWGGAADPFAMSCDFVPATGMDRMRVGTPDILSLLALDAALDVWDGVELSAVRAKGLTLTGFFMECVDELLGPDLAHVVTPRGDDRGHQVSLRVNGAAQLVSRLAERGVIVDWRPPDLLRCGFAPLYTTYGQALRAARALQDLLES
jgi:kynureninase